MIERRGLLKGAGAALTASLFTGRVRGANDRITTGHIGIGAMGTTNLGIALKNPEIEPVAVCDVYQPTLDKAVDRASQAGKTVKAIRDFREILADKSIDAVCISTPDHWHAYMTVEACKAGKDVYVENRRLFMSKKAERWCRPRANTIAWCRPEQCSGQGATSRRQPRSSKAVFSAM